MSRRRDFDLLRVFSMLGVIYLHVASGALNRPGETLLWDFSNVITALATAAVPLFFMLSGALLLSQNKTADPGYLFKKRLPRVVVPACVWTVVLLCYFFATGKAEQAVNSIYHLLNTPVVIPYWFFYALLPVYLLSPFVKLAADRMEDTHWTYAMMLWLCLTLGLSSVRLFAPQSLELTFTEHWTLNINVAGGYMGYFLLGHWLDKRGTADRKLPALCAAVCLIVSILGTRWDTRANMVYSTRFTEYLSLLTALLAASLFMLAKQLWGKKESGKVLSLLSELTFPVYLIHPLVIGVVRLLWWRLFAGTDPVTIPQQLGFYLLAAAGSLAGAAVLSAIPGVCFLFTGRSRPIFHRNEATKP